MATAIQRRRGTTEEHATFAGLAGEVTVDTTKKTLVVHDGETAGGSPLATEQFVAQAMADGELASEAAAGRLRLATQEQAEAGTENGAYAMTPLRVAQYMEAKFLAYLRENVGEAVTEELTSSWAHTVGEFYYFRHPTLKPGFAPAQGGLISGNWQGKPITDYPIWQYLQTAEGQKLLKTEAEWQAMTRATWHTCADGTKIGWNGIGGAPFLVQDLGAGTLRMPDLRGMHIEAAGFNALDVGGAAGDHGREMIAAFGQTISGAGVRWAAVSGAFELLPNQPGGQESTTAYNNGTLLRLRVSRVWPTGPNFVPRRWGALACVYLGQPAS